MTAGELLTFYLSLPELSSEIILLNTAHDGFIGTI